MKFLLLEWNVFMEQDLEDSLKRMHIDFRVFFYPFSRDIILNDDEYFEEHFKKVLMSGCYDAVFSFNFRPPVAKCCHETNTPYISWVYDSGVGHTVPREIINFSTNYIFLFDRDEYKKGEKSSKGRNIL